MKGDYRVKTILEHLLMKKKTTEAFGDRLAKIRKSRGLTQTELGDKVGVTLRVISYYENESGQPPGSILADLSKVLDVSVDELLGVKPVKSKSDPKKARLRKRLMKAERLSPTDQRAVLKYIDMLLDRNQKSKMVGSRQFLMD